MHVENEYWRDLEDITCALTVPDLRDAIMAALATIGFQAAFFLTPITSDPRCGRVLTNLGFPIAWEKAYRKILHLSDPLPELAIARAHAFQWSGLSRDGTLSEAHRQYLRHLGQFDMQDGVAIPCYGPLGRTGLMGAGRAKKEIKIDTQTLLRVHFIGQLSFTRYCVLLHEENDDQVKLSQRELDVLHWIARGKSNSVIAQLLDLSPATVDTYIRRLFEKLHVSDRSAAAARAQALGLIFVGKFRAMPEVLPIDKAG